MTGRRPAGALIVTLALLLAACTSGDDATDDVAPSASTSTSTSTEATPNGYERDEELAFNQIQVVGTHNSYHRPPQEALATVLDSVLPGLTDAWRYEHAPLTEQLDRLGVRQLELDVWADPEGGRFAERRAQEYAGLPRDPGIAELGEPGLKVLHLPEVDVESTCWTFVSCLDEIATWSSDNPGHVPITVLVEPKADEVPDPFDLGFQAPLSFGTDELASIEEEIRSVFEPDDLITPDLVRGDRDTLEEAVTTDGWPVLGDIRGRVMFVLLEQGEPRDLYLEGNPSLEGRTMFTWGSEPGRPDSAVLTMDDPGDRRADIEAAVRAGYLVRTRADAVSGLENDDVYERRDLAIDSGAQFVSTDYPEPADDFDPGYEVKLEGGTPGRCNPLIAPPWCESTDVENPALLHP